MQDLKAYLAMLFRHRTLTEILVARELKARYRGTALGFLWSFVNPLLMMAIYTLVFSLTMRLPVPHYGAFVMVGILPWNAFVAGMTEGMHALVANGNLIRKVALPAEVFPLVAVLANMAHFAFSLPVLLGVLLMHGLTPHVTWLLWPLFAFEQLLYAWIFATLLASFAVQYRDLTHIVPNIVMMLFYVTPIVYPPDMVPTALRPYMAFNPLSPLIYNYRTILLDGGVPALGSWAVRVTCAALVLAASLWCFRGRRDLYPELV